MNRLLVLTALLLLLPFPFPLFATSVEPALPTPEETALFLAGLPCVAQSPLKELEKGKDWQGHATLFNEDWSKLEKRQLKPIRAWIPAGLNGQSGSTGPMFYMFSGPDFLYASTFYPNASTYVLAGLEPVGPLPNATALGDKLSDSLSNLRKSLEAVLNWSFFRTKDMKVDLQQTQLSGTLPVLYVFLARQSCHLQSVDFVALDKEGKIVPAQVGAMGVRILFNRPGQSTPQTLYYFSTNLADGEIQPKFLKFLNSLGDGVSLLKAASYLMHSEGFSTIRNQLLSHSRLLVEDDSGIPLKYFAPETWKLRLEGVYTAPIPLFKERFQPDLLSAYQASKTSVLPFGFGYQWKASISNLMVAERIK